MNNKTPVIFFSSLNINRGGITRAVLKRANLLAEKYKNVIIITTFYQQNHKKIINELYKRGMLSRKVKVLNFFESMREVRGKRTLNIKNKHKIQEKGYEVFHITSHPENSYRYYKDGFYKMYKRFTKNKINFIDYMDESAKRIKREEYDENGFLVRIRYMDKSLNKSSFDQYFDYKGKCYLSVHVNPKSEEDGITVYYGSKSKTYEKLNDLRAEWLNNELNKLKEPVVFSELRGFDEMLIKVKHPKIKRIAVIHSSHLIDPFNDIKKVRPSYRHLFSNAEFDKYVFLTKAQKEDAEIVFGKRHNYVVIPHAHESVGVEGRKSNVNRNELIAVSLARYAEDKRVHESIHAFKYVVDKVPNAKLYLYGIGPLKKDLQKLINNLNLEKNVILKGYATNAQKVYQSAMCSILTSRREGFGMVMTESMAQGTPVIAYDFKYGPQEIIKDGENGFIVENGNRKELANKIIKVMTDNKLREQLSQNAFQVRNTFSEKRHKKDWLQLIKNI